MAGMNRRNWIAVASAEHARRGRDNAEGGFMQVSHGKLAPLKRVATGDRIAFYAPALTLVGTQKLQSFVTIGVVHGDEPYEADMGNRFVPWRRDVRYARATETPILTLIEQFDFVEDPKRWGYKFRFGMFELNEHDMRLIADAMKADSRALAL
jgi:EVE domain